MKTRQHEREETPRQAAGPAVGPDDVGALRERSQRLLAAGADAIEHALSSDSEAFLKASRQEGGQ